MTRVTGHREPRGTFVDAKTNAAALLNPEIQRKPMDRVWVSGVCDPYQPAETQLRLTRRCLEILARQDWPVTSQTKSPLVVRDLDARAEKRNALARAFDRNATPYRLFF